MNTGLKNKPDLSFAKLWNLSFGFFGVQIAYALQSANISRIFATLGADPHSLSYFWILPPLMGIIVQPIVGTLSDKTWCRFGRRIPYLFVGALVAVAVMCLLPNAGSFGMAVSTAMVFGLIALMFLDTSINMAMQPFKMLVGDMVNEKQKALAYSIQSFLCNAGSLAGYVFPFLFTFLGISNVAPQGRHPRLRDILILRRRGHTHPLRHLHFGQGKGDAAEGIRRIPRPFQTAQRGTRPTG